MKKPIVAIVAVGAVVALRPVVKRRILEVMREHCAEMATRFAGGSEATGQQAMGPHMREHCEQMAAQRSDPVATA